MKSHISKLSLDRISTIYKKYGKEKKRLYWRDDQSLI